MSTIIFDPATHTALVPQLAQIHIDCINEDATIATFIPPLSKERVTQWWTARVQEQEAGHRFIVVHLEGGKAAGVAMLGMPWSETGPFRGLVEKLLVSPRHRNKGVGRKVMKVLEEEALRRGRPLLVLDTIVGSPAEMIYPKLGYTRVGIVPKYGISPKDGSLKDEVWFYKDLREE